MKKIPLLIASLIFSAFNLQAQVAETVIPPQKEVRKINGTIKISPFDFVASTFTLGGELAVGKAASIQVYGSFILNEDKNNYSYNGYDNNKIRSVGGAAEVQFKRFVYTRVAPLDGMYVGVFGKYVGIQTESEQSVSNYYNSYPSVSTTKNEYMQNLYSGGVIAGYQLIIANTLVLDGYVGGGVKLSSDNYNNNNNLQNTAGDIDIFYPSTSGIMPKAGIKIGVTF